MQPVLLPLLTSALSSAEVRYITPAAQAYQQACMQNLLAIDNAGLIRRYDLVESEKDTDACNWMGVTCNNGYVHHIDWNELSPMALRSTDEFLDGPSGFLISWLPPSVHRVDMSGLSIASRFLTKWLPRDLEIAGFDQCNLGGTIDCEHLPRNLRNLFLQRNHLSGSVILRNLPWQLVQIDLSHNPIEHAFVVNRDIPESLQFIVFFNEHNKVRYTALDGKKVDKRVHTDKGDVFFE